MATWFGGLLVASSIDSAPAIGRVMERSLRELGIAPDWFWLAFNGPGPDFMVVHLRGGEQGQCTGRDECWWWSEHYELGGQVAAAARARTIVVHYFSGATDSVLAARYEADGTRSELQSWQEGEALPLDHPCDHVLGKAGAPFPSTVAELLDRSRLPACTMRLDGVRTLVALGDAAEADSFVHLRTDDARLVHGIADCAGVSAGALLARLWRDFARTSAAEPQPPSEERRALSFFARYARDHGPRFSVGEYERVFSLAAHEITSSARERGVDEVDVIHECLARLLDELPPSG